MNLENGDIQIFTGNSNKALVAKICESLGVKQGDCVVNKFSDGEIQIDINETVRGKDVYIIQSTSNPVNDNLMEVLILVDALKRASAGRINVVMPYYGYARQDRKTKAREPITSKLVADLLEVAGAQRIVTMDLHAGQIQGYFNVPVDHLTAIPYLSEYFKDIVNEDPGNFVVVSPDLGGVTRARKFANRLNLPIAIIEKRRPKPNVSEVMNIIGDIDGKNCILIDDIIDTAGTICKAAEALRKNGAKKVYGCASHGVLSGEAFNRLENSIMEKFVISNTIEVPEEKLGKVLEVVNVAPIFASAIRRINGNKSVSEMFD
ncbi:MULTISPECIES: ribose-phosphate diphosphokinase [Peptoniphilus]|uniref:Ribose-phosphate pyrophosphokinase n=2 Tax=Peptoniphilus TaxID=162289 RepID=E0NNH2_9FIRM|nr:MULTISPECIES: ribose-phosphate pyrophosphokinase [Peptoniphilus]EFM24661.1 ribose-phosphate diphosphokinase [Peptoniphilus duerdenii ATCC BAA-1640]ERT63059.1 ribose-phosphate diphosphokinase [Peptoniphilus sp. BV3AC2]MDK8276642.1 ribose-phosphate pyrophosphokinase [Peptoniphilus duerdenii]